MNRLVGWRRRYSPPLKVKMNLTICVYILDIVGYSVVGYRPSPGLANCYTKEILNKHIVKNHRQNLCQ